MNGTQRLRSRDGREDLDSRHCKLQALLLRWQTHEPVMGGEGCWREPDESVRSQDRHALTWAELPDYLLARGTTVLTSEEAAELTGTTNPSTVRSGLGRLHEKGELFSPTRGFYVVIAPEFRAWGGAIPAEDFIDPMMRYLGRSYYIGLLSAAQRHGAAHQRPQVTQVMVDSPFRDRSFGRVRLGFYVNGRLDETPTQQVTTRTGQVTVSTPEATVFDLVTRHSNAGGLDNFATILAELAQDEMLDPHRLAEVAALAPASTVHRTGWILDEFSEGFDTGPLAAVVATDSLTALDPQAGRRGRVDPTWRVIVNARIEPDL